MKKLMLGIVLLLFFLSFSMTFSYWYESRLENVVEKDSQSLNLGVWKFKHDIFDIDGVIYGKPIFGNSNLKVNQVYYFDDHFHVVFYNRGGMSWESSWNNPMISFKNDYQSNLYYKEKHSVVIKDGHIFIAGNGDASNQSPKIGNVMAEGVGQGQYAWFDLGTLSEKTWLNDRKYSEGDIVYYNGNLYRANHFIQTGVEPSGGRSWNLLNSILFDPYTIYERYEYKDGAYINPVVIYQGILYQLQSNSNLVSNQLIIPGEDHRIWKAYPYE